MKELNQDKLKQQINDYLHFCEYVKQYSLETVRDKHYVFRLFLKENNVTSMADYTNADLNNWMANMALGLNREQHCRPNTINKRVKTISAFVKYLMSIGEPVAINPLFIQYAKKDIERRKSFTPQQLNKALQYGDLQDKVMYSIMRDSGMRLGELAKMRRCDIVGRVIKVISKGGKIGECYITEDTKQMLEEYLIEYGITDKLWVSDKFSKRTYLTACSIRRRGHAMFEQAGIDGFYPHAIRHSYATNLRENNAPLDVIMKLMRHESLETTQIYLHNLDKDLTEVYDKYIKL